MADVAQVLTAFRAELIAAGLVRRPTDAGAAPPMVIMPAEGAPAPGEAEGIVDTGLILSILHGGNLSEATGYEAAQRRRVVVDVRYRSKINADLRAAMALDVAVINRLIRPATNYGYGFVMGGLFVHAVGVWAGLGPVSSSKGQGFDEVAKYLVEVPS